jgi:hypothetical protein
VQDINADFDLIILEDAPQVQRTGVAPAAEPLHPKAPRTPLTPEQRALAAAIWQRGGSKLEVCEALGLTASNFEARKAWSDLRHLESRRGARTDLANRPAIGREAPPTPEEIAIRAAAIRDGWDAATERMRRGLSGTDGPMDSAGFAACPARGVILTRLPTRWA